MSYNVYKQEGDSRHLLDSRVDYRTAEYYRSTCRNVVVEDCDAWRIDLPSDGELEAMYGVRDGTIFSACVIFACILLVPALIILALLTQ
jgi:hypothetical protein